MQLRHSAPQLAVILVLSIASASLGLKVASPAPARLHGLSMLSPKTKRQTKETPGGRKSPSATAPLSVAPASFSMGGLLLSSRMDAWLLHLLAGESPEECASETAAMLEELRHAYTAGQVPEVLQQECGHFIFYKNFGSKPEVCLAIVDYLIKTWRGDRDYLTWCAEVYSKRHTAKSADDIPCKDKSKIPEGEYADVKEFSYPKDADPELPCHGAVPCPSK